MAEAEKKGTSSVKPKGKTSDLDLDFGKDFLTSWKDDGMDFDFGSPAKGNKKAFDFGKVDLDFNLDGDFGKFSSFKIDMPDLDISSPQRKAGKEKEQSNISSSESKRKKKDSFAFSIDFNEFEDMNFEKTLEKGTSRFSNSKSKEVSSSQSGSGIPGTHLIEDNAPMEEDISSKLPEAHCGKLSELDTEVDNRTADVRDEVVISKSMTEEHCTQIPINSEENDTTKTARDSPDSVSTFEKEQYNQQLGKVSHEEAYHLDLVEDLSGQSIADNASIQNTHSYSQEEVFTSANVNSSISGEENFNEKSLRPESINGSPREESQLSESVTNSLKEDGDRSKFVDANNVHIVADGFESTHCEVEHQFENSSTNKLQGAMLHEGNQDSTSKLHAVPVKSGTANNDLVAEIEKISDVVQSKYFKKPGETESQSQQASLSRTKLVSTDSTRITKQVNILDDRVTGLKSTQSGISLADISRSQPKNLGCESVQTENMEVVKGANINRMHPKAGTIEPASKLAARTHDQELGKEGFALRGSEHSNRLSLKAGAIEPGSKLAVRTHDQDLGKKGSSLRRNEKSIEDPSTLRVSPKAGTTEPGSKLAARLHDQALGGKEGFSLRSEKNIEYPSTLRVSPKAGTIEPGMVTRTHDQDLGKEGFALKRSEKNIEDPSTLSSGMHPSSLNGHTSKLTSKSSINLRLPVSSITSMKHTPKLLSEKNGSSPDQASRQTPELSVLKSLRTTGGKLEPLNSSLLKGFKSTKNSENENVGPKKKHSTDTKVQAPTTLTLKRKAFEDSNANKLNFTPSKRLSASPGVSRNAREPSDGTINKKACNHENLVNDSTRNSDYPLDVNYAELETTLSLETDSNVEKAEALSKELENICNMLKKKHEEAKELLVRAIVNNNNLLMLNHPMQQEKICMVQKFAALLISKSEKT